MSNQTENARSLKFPLVPGEFTRESPAIAEEKACWNALYTAHD